ncbi:MAG: uracil-DNA glycosylase [Micropepsaceae bacterium]
MPAPAPEAPRDCPLCPRLAEFRKANKAALPAYFNGAVPSFGETGARLLIVGLAPGLHGANRTGRPFTGDYAGDLLYATLDAVGLLEGKYAARPDDGIRLKDTMISNAVRCVPPQNKPETTEIRICNGFLKARIQALPQLRAIVALGTIAHNATLTALDVRKSAHKFGHGAVHDLPGVRLYDSYHCSRYNTNTGVLTPAMFRAVFDRVASDLKG